MNGLQERRRNLYGATWAGLTGVAQLSDVALPRRIRGAANWPRQIAGALLAQRSATGDELPAPRLRIVDGTSISCAGDYGTTWRIHASFDPATSSFTDLQVTGADVGEGHCHVGGSWPNGAGWAKLVG